MPSTRPSVFVFDFDGTLVQSAAAKRQAFFDIFQPPHAPAIDAVLTIDPDGSRYSVIPKMIAEIARRGLPPAGSAHDLVEAYGVEADRRVAAAPETPGATALLRRLAGSATLYIASATPHDQLVTHIARRGWTPLVAGEFGYPKSKTTTVAELIARHGIAPAELMMVGDGVSDAEAAAANGAGFHKISKPSDLVAVGAMAVAADV